VVLLTTTLKQAILGLWEFRGIDNKQFAYYKRIGQDSNKLQKAEFWEQLL
jgi:hypothetical protein